MVRLIDFSSAGIPEIDDSWYALPEWDEMRRVLHKDYGLIIVLLHSYRSPYNRLLPEERRKRVLADFPRKFPASTLKPTEKQMEMVPFKRAEEVFIELRFDPRWDRLLMLENKVHEFTDTIRDIKISPDKASADDLKALASTQAMFEEQYELLRIQLFRLSTEKKGGVRQAKASDLFRQV